MPENAPSSLLRLGARMSGRLASRARRALAASAQALDAAPPGPAHATARRARRSDLPDDGILHVAVPEGCRTGDGGLLSSGAPFTIGLQACATRDLAEEAGRNLHGRDLPVVAFDATACGEAALFLDERRPGTVTIWGRIPPDALVPETDPAPGPSR